MILISTENKSVNDGYHRKISQFQSYHSQYNGKYSSHYSFTLICCDDVKMTS